MLVVCHLILVYRLMFYGQKVYPKFQHSYKLYKVIQLICWVLFAANPLGPIFWVHILWMPLDAYLLDAYPDTIWMPNIRMPIFWMPIFWVPIFWVLSAYYLSVYPPNAFGIQSLDIFWVLSAWNPMGDLNSRLDVVAIEGCCCFRTCSTGCFSERYRIVSTLTFHWVSRSPLAVEIVWRQKGRLRNATGTSSQNCHWNAIEIVTENAAEISTEIATRF